MRLYITSIHARAKRVRQAEFDTPPESFNGRFRNECLDEHWFSDIIHALKIIND